MNFQPEKNGLAADAGKKQVLFRIEKTGEAKKDLILSQDFKENNLIKKCFDSKKNNNSNDKINENLNSEKTLKQGLSNTDANLIANRNSENNLTADNFIRKFTKKSVWTLEEDTKLSDLVQLYGKKSWKEIAKNFTNKSRKQCFIRWRKHLAKISNSNSYQNNAIGAYRLKSESAPIDNSKKTWTENEDEIIIRWVNIMGNKNWTKCSKLLIDKSPKDCKSRWFDKLEYEESKKHCGSSSNDYWGKKNEILLLLFIRKFGTCWSKLAKFFENKSGNQIKNKFYCLARLTFKNTDASVKNANNNFQMEVEAKENLNKENYNINKDKDINSAMKNNNYEDEEEEISNTEIKDKAEKIIAYLVNSNDEYVYNQNVRVFREAKKCYNDRIAAIYGASQKPSNCISDLESKDNRNTENLIQNITKGIWENNATKNLQAEEEAKKFNICSGCLLKLRNHIKRKIIAKLKSQNFDFNRCTAQMAYNQKVLVNGANKELNFSFSANVDKSEILNKIPQLFELINSLKEKIVN